MEKRIELEKRGKNPSQIKELNLDNCRSTSIVGLTEEFCNLEILSLINVGLTNLKGFPKLPNLRKLELSDNRISGGLNFLSGSPKLAYLNLSGNKIGDIETLEPLKDFKYLKFLDLFNCDVTSVENYREKAFSLMPDLKFLDGYDIDDKEGLESEDGNDDNENFDDSDLDLDGEDEDVEEEEEEDGVRGRSVGLAYLEKDDIDEESEGEDFNPEEVDDEDDEDDDDDKDSDNEEDGEDGTPKAKKRKIENSDD